LEERLIRIKKFSFLLIFYISWNSTRFYS